MIQSDIESVRHFSAGSHLSLWGSRRLLSLFRDVFLAKRGRSQGQSEVFPQGGSDDGTLCTQRVHIARRCFHDTLMLSVSACLPACLASNPSVSPSIHPSTCLSLCLSAWLTSWLQRVVQCAVIELVETTKRYRRFIKSERHKEPARTCSA